MYVFLLNLLDVNNLKTQYMYIGFLLAFCNGTHLSSVGEFGCKEVVLVITEGNTRPIIRKTKQINTNLE